MRSLLRHCSSYRASDAFNPQQRTLRVGSGRGAGGRYFVKSPTRSPVCSTTRQIVRRREYSDRGTVSGLIIGLRPASERQRYFLTTSLSLPGRKPRINPSSSLFRRLSGFIALHICIFMFVKTALLACNYFLEKNE